MIDRRQMFRPMTSPPQTRFDDLCLLLVGVAIVVLNVLAEAFEMPLKAGAGCFLPLVVESGFLHMAGLDYPAKGSLSLRLRPKRIAASVVKEFVGRHRGSVARGGSQG
jgi:hypothetical protein